MRVLKSADTAQVEVFLRPDASPRGDFFLLTIEQLSFLREIAGRPKCHEPEHLRLRLARKMPLINIVIIVKIAFSEMPADVVGLCEAMASAQAERRKIALYFLMLT